MTVAQRLNELGIELATPRSPQANYVSAVRTGNLVFLSGTGPYLPDGGLVTGKVGGELTVEQGYAAARWAMLALLANLQAELGDLERVARVVKLLGMVNCTVDFTRQPEVINGASDLLVEVLGERGRHARSAVGMFALPRNIAVEIEMIVEIA
jgi:enamine deaminase RidA (YjgF/YER057c/UK114 family)